MNRRLFVPIFKSISSTTKKKIDESIFNDTNYFQSIKLVQNPNDSRLYGYFRKNYKYRQLGFTEPDYETFLNRILTSYLNRRELTASTKTKSEVRGGGKKPWRQKGLGRARAGSSRSPLWKGGGVCFGPKPKLMLPKINKKEYSLAIRLLIRLAYKQNRLLIIQPLISQPIHKVKKTREMQSLFDSISKKLQNRLPSQSIKFILSTEEFKIFGKSFSQSTANLPKSSVISESEINLMTFTKPVMFVFTLDAFLNSRSKFM